jgi:Excreted virulence factor EspC, type VII ESX diderm
MATIHVKPEEVRRMAGRLRGLKQAFEGLDDDAHRHSSVPIAGDERVAARLREFASNWRDRRVRLAGRMEELARHADAAATAYEETDRGASPN